MIHTQTIRVSLLSVMALAFAMFSVLAVGAQSYDGDTVEPDINGDYAVTAQSGDTVTLNNLGSGGSLDVTFANGVSGTIEVTTSAGVPAGAPSASPGTANIYLDITLTGLTNADVSSAVYRFTVTQTWLDDQGLGSENVFLYHYNGTAWEQLPTTLVSSVGGTHTYDATISSFSPFAITAVAGLTNTGSPAYLTIAVAGALVIALGTVTVLSRRGTKQ